VPDTRIYAGRYNMSALVKLQEIEDKYREQLCELYGMDEDTLMDTIDFDIHKVAPSHCLMCVRSSNLS
jgi:hypothetical protein